MVYGHIGYKIKKERKKNTIKMEDNVIGNDVADDRCVHLRVRNELGVIYYNSNTYLTRVDVRL